MLKSNQDDKYSTCCFIQEAAPAPEMSGLIVLKSEVDGKPYCQFDSTLWSFDHMNRMHRWYDINNAKQVITSDERIQDLKKRGIWRGEWNHPNPDIEGTQLTAIRMTIPEPMRTSHYIDNDRFEGMKYRARITTASGTPTGQAVNHEILDRKAIEAFSVRLMGMMIPRSPVGRPNMNVKRVITFDMVDFPSHDDAVADVTRPVVEYVSCTFLKDLAKYCAEQDESLAVVCESFEISPEELFGITTESVEIHQDGNKILIPTPMKIRDEVASILRGRSF